MKDHLNEKWLSLMERLMLTNRAISLSRCLTTGNDKCAISSGQLAMDCLAITIGNGAVAAGQIGWSALITSTSTYASSATAERLMDHSSC